MKISLSPELKNYLDEKVQAGQYESVTDAVLEGLRALKEQEEQRQRHLAELRAEIELSLANSEAAESSPQSVGELRPKKRFLEAIREGEEDLRAGRYRRASAIFAELKAMNGY